MTYLNNTTNNYHAADAVASSSVLGSETFDMDAMTPDALIMYLSSRIGSVDEQMSDVFERQKNSEKVRTELRAIQEDLTKIQPDTDKQKEMVLDLAVTSDICKHIDTIALTDKPFADKLRAHLFEEGQVLGDNNLKYTTFELDASKDYLGFLAKDLESGAQMDMIQLQSMMGARQTAIQLSTNLIAALNESQKSVVSNIR
jgi:hypothetical protein